LPGRGLEPLKIAPPDPKFKTLDESGIEAHLPTIVAEWIETHKARTASVTFLTLFDEYLAAKHDRDPQYLRELRICRD
jgi:hypothetical protein